VKLNIFKSKEVKLPEYESDKEKNMLALKDALSHEEKKEFRDQLVSLMVPIICWKEFSGSKNAEWAISIIKGRHIIEDLKLKNPSLGENHINYIWNICFKRAKELVRAEIGDKKMKDQIVNSLNWNEVFEVDYVLSVAKSNYLLKTSFGKNFPVVITLVALFFSLSVALFNLPLIPYSNEVASLFFCLSCGMLWYVCVVTFLLIDDLILKAFLFIAYSALLIWVAITFVDPPQPKPITSTVPQSSASVKPSSSPKPGFTEPLKNSQSVHQKENR
jgi:Domain of unknown function DUF29